MMPRKNIIKITLHSRLSDKKNQRLEIIILSFLNYVNEIINLKQHKIIKKNLKSIFHFPIKLFLK